MPYFTSWDVNLFLCLCHIGVPIDLVRILTRGIRDNREKLILEDSLSYYRNRKHLFPKDLKLLRDRPAARAYGYAKELNLNAISNIESLPHRFFRNLQKVNYEYEKKIMETEPYKRNHFYETASFYNWSDEELEWVKGFHPGRIFLLDLKCKREKIESVLDSSYPWLEKQFIKNHYHIEDIVF